ncbi:hypothetical protein CEUSTIGMA_g258.t1 [Chlamydomonas eustigma]|uniref:Uncharacterized protein n=1 Tax=Chlamydomonas eustigma TaxID=1157962 RepID=A0A250WPQ7_9CHLO|nr:hypothetical protein CEUSTIGMA_g258.t1 [Chlamydomonas eustigma]|eukprot:GAX72803.1 hypothetical protein CEUSTIGMA_g258.t1 [Chlamydomonas eustigma]
MLSSELVQDLLTRQRYVTEACLARQLSRHASTTSYRNFIRRHLFVPATTQGLTNASGDASTSSSSRPHSTAGSRPAFLICSQSNLLRRLMSLADATSVGEVLAEELNNPLSEEDCCFLISAALEKGNIQLAISVHSAMRAARRPQPTASSSTFSWPPSTNKSTSTLVLGLCQQIAITEASRTISDIRVQGILRHEDISFGKVITSPLAPGRTLTVAQPQEGFKLVADAYSKYEYEIFTGRVVSINSEAIPSLANNPFFKVARALGLQRSAAAAAVHTLTIQAPDGTSRTFRCATETSEVPAQASERVTVVSCPFKNSKKGNRPIFSATPPGWGPGEAMQATNHVTGVITPLLQPPVSSTTQTGIIPAWLLPAAVLLAGGDAVSSVIDPALPAMIAAGSITAIGTLIAGSTVIVPRLKQLSDRDVSLEYIRQQLLGQYAGLVNKSDNVTKEALEEVRVLARLWQLQTKMESVGNTASAYEARIKKVTMARESIEARLKLKLDLLDGYSRVMNMIEIEVEMDIAVPDAELLGIEEQLVRLEELEGLKEDWVNQAEAREEVEKLLKSM